MQQTMNVAGITQLFEEMLEDLKSEYLSRWTGGDGVPHPAGVTRWARDDADYRARFAAVMAPPPPEGVTPDHTNCVACKAGYKYDHNPLIPPVEK